KSSSICPGGACGPENTSSMPIVATHVLLAPPLAVVRPPQPVTTSAPSAVAAMITRPLTGTPSNFFLRILHRLGSYGVSGHAGLRPATEICTPLAWYGSLFVHPPGSWRRRPETMSGKPVQAQTFGCRSPGAYEPQLCAVGGPTSAQSAL